MVYKSIDIFSTMNVHSIEQLLLSILLPVLASCSEGASAKEFQCVFTAEVLIINNVVQYAISNTLPVGKLLLSAYSSK